MRKGYSAELTMPDSADLKFAEVFSSIQLVARTKNPLNIRNELATKFPLLYEPPHAALFNSLRGSARRSMKSDLSSSSGSSPMASKRLDAMDLSKSGSPSEVQTAELLEAFSNAVRRFGLAEYQEKFTFLAACADLTKPDAEGRKLYDAIQESKLSKAIIRQAFTALQVRVLALRSRKNEKLLEKSQKIEMKLFKSGLILTCEEPLTTPQFDKISSDAKIVKNLQILWAFCSVTNQDSQRCFDKNQLSLRILGLQGLISAYEAILALQLLYPNFDKYQQLIALFIIKEILSNDAQYQLCHDELFQDNLELFLKIALNDTRFQLKELVEKIKSYFKSIQKLQCRYQADMVVKNSKIFNEWLTSDVLLKQLPSFTEVLTSALKANDMERKKIVKSIASELSMLMIFFYSKIRLSEFKQNGWSKEDKATRSPHIVFLTQYTNALIQFLIGFVLSQPQSDIHLAMQLLTEIEWQLAQSTNGLGPDLQSLMIIHGALYSQELSRLTEYIAKLTEQARGVRTETSTIVQKKWMRKVMEAYRHSIPFLGLLLTDVTFSIDGNECPLTSAELLGGIFSHILTLQEFLQTYAIGFTTDILNMVRSYKSPADGEHYNMSTRIQPVRMQPNSHVNVLNLDEMISVFNLNSILNKKNYIQNKSIPSVLFNGQIYEPIELPRRLIDWFLKLINLKIRIKTQDETMTIITVCFDNNTEIQVTKRKGKKRSFVYINEKGEEKPIQKDDPRLQKNIEYHLKSLRLLSQLLYQFKLIIDTDYPEHNYRDDFYIYDLSDVELRLSLLADRNVMKAHRREMASIDKTSKPQSFFQPVTTETGSMSTPTPMVSSFQMSNTGTESVSISTVSSDQSSLISVI
ncbi:MAG: hypothetical protein JSS53_08150 [Proteobacteria bacterium]|nr:hypothetical protein [Pseudomonadota bacterium]